MFDFVLVGGGLQNALIAVALCQRVPGVAVALIERDSSLGGNHTWCFHDGDVEPSAHSFVDPFVVHRWPGCSVQFPGLRRRLHIGYAAITSERLHQVVVATLQETPGCQLFCGQTATHIAAHHVTLDNGTHLQARVVVDARGPSPVTQATGYQKFLGQEIVTDRPHGLGVPVIMDADLIQTDGYRFMYLLPFANDRLLVEETFFSDTAALDTHHLRQSLADYIRARGWRAVQIVREESGVLPMPWRGQFPIPRTGPLRAGYRGGLFHPATGYSLPVAARLADFVSRNPSGQFFDDELRAMLTRERRQREFAYRLNKMLFTWFPGPQRRNLFERFYRLPEATIRRFYSMQMNRIDRARMFWGRPPKGLSWRAVAFGGLTR